MAEHVFLVVKVSDVIPGSDDDVTDVNSYIHLLFNVSAVDKNIAIKYEPKHKLYTQQPMK